MKKNTVRYALTIGAACCMAANPGCVTLDAGTKVSDGDAKLSLGEYRGLKHAVGVKDFENQAGWKGQWQLGYNLSIMLESALYDTGRFVIVEREKLSSVMAEQDLVAGGRAAKAGSVAQTGMIRPARYIATGAVTEVSEGASGLGGGIAIKGVAVGGASAQAAITIIAKLVDTTTGEVVAKKRIVGRAGRVGLGIGIAGTVRGRPFATALGGFAKTPLGEAAQDCINQAAVFLAKAVEELPFDGSVVKVSPDGVVINRGSEYGLTPGQMFTMRERGEMLTDPETGAILGREQGKVIGQLKVEKVLDKISYCSVVSGESNPKPGTVVSDK